MSGTGNGAAKALSVLDQLSAFRVKVHSFTTATTGVSGYVREPSAIDHIRIKQLAAAFSGGKKGDEDVQMPGYVIVPLLLCNADGSPVFDDYEAGIKYLGALESSVMAELVDNVLRLSGIGTRSVEAAEKNSSATQTSVSPSGSPVI